MTRIRKAVFPVAGMGTRFLPATKSVPKEMLPLIDRPLIQYAVDEARAAGIEEFIFITATGKGALEDYFSTAAALERRLQDAGKHDALAALGPSRMPEGRLTFLRQDHPKGLGHAVSLARHLIGDEPFAVLLPDDVIRAGRPCLSQMAQAHAGTGGHMVATMEVPRHRTGAYGVLDVARLSGRLAHARGLVEKPHPDHAPSALAVIGRYILSPSIFDRLAEIPTGAGGELQLTDAIAADLPYRAVSGYRFEGERYDCGSVPGYLEATAAFALDRPDLADGFADFVAGRLAPQARAA
ncbi:UTP--glucose-1-phosphate uridylyltransferase [Rhodovulum adriaticum]|uniref:UTP--glucose-1-phosphate uridylyltransferase n=1 Tax=Rhodovulum adriaticum TaxID=35804 RepID=A0A4R2NZ78_RHOAD|nr:UTP--glucose-1-phosphate uridylyltransferase [Rhodovulum adriaticum]MBK1634807.1 UTP--glucose-1-phosphate uridylyltransferase [Rhodovulum adriaticum]TCP27619.1 UTP--glucose-1-phosphate uridylyltransferase [Rhodovulum adriaticum]